MTRSVQPKRLKDLVSKLKNFRNILLCRYKNVQNEDFEGYIFKSSSQTPAGQKKKQKVKLEGVKQIVEQKGLEKVE